jgi:ankyrin repeat protein
MAVQALLIGEIDIFNKRLKVLCDAWEKISKEPSDKEVLREALKKVLMSEPSYQHDGVTFVDVLAFLDGVELYAQPAPYRYLFDKEEGVPSSQDVLLTSLRVSSKRLEEKGGICRAPVSIGVYNEQQLKFYLELIRDQVFLKNQTIPLNLGVVSSDHIVIVGYHPIDGDEPWIFVDANRLPSKRFSMDVIAKEVLHGLRTAKNSNDEVIILVDLYGIKSDEPALKSTIECVKQSEAWQTLCSHTTQVHTLDGNGATLLYMAARHGHTDLVDVALASGANVNQSCSDGDTPLFIAAQNGHLQIVAALIQAKANVDQPRNDGFTPLYMAVQKGNFAIVDALIREGADVNRVWHGVTPLYLAVERGYIDVVDRLLKAGVNVNQAWDGMTALYMAAELGHTEIVRTLLAAGADATCTYNSVSPQQIAERNGHRNIVDLLKPKDSSPSMTLK